MVDVVLSEEASLRSNAPRRTFPITKSDVGTAIMATNRSHADVDILKRAVLPTFVASLVFRVCIQIREARRIRGEIQVLAFLAEPAALILSLTDGIQERIGRRQRLTTAGGRRDTATFLDGPRDVGPCITSHGHRINEGLHERGYRFAHAFCPCHMTRSFSRCCLGSVTRIPLARRKV